MLKKKKEKEVEAHVKSEGTAHLFNSLCARLRRTRLSFFFQEEDGIRDPLVTGVQTCALPIWKVHPIGLPERSRGCSSPAQEPTPTSTASFSSDNLCCHDSVRSHPTTWSELGHD